MTLFEFVERYKDEESCKKAWKAHRDQEGVECKKCKNHEHYWKSDKEQYECKMCGFRTTLRSGTVMQNSKLSYLDWFRAIHLMTSMKKNISAKEMQRQLGKKRYEPVWAMMHKIRSVMGLRDDQYQLRGSVEMDEGFFTTAVYNREEITAKRGRGSQMKTCVSVMAESEEVTDELAKKNKGRPKRRCGYFKMKVLRKVDSSSVEGIVKDSIEPSSEVISDGARIYSKVKGVVKDHKQEVVEAKQADKLLPWVHIAISNAKRVLLDTYHCIDQDFLGNYLNEFCYKLNRRYFNNLMDRALIAAVSLRWNYLG